MPSIEAMGTATKSPAACYSDSELHVTWSGANRKGMQQTTESEMVLEEFNQ